MVVKTKINDSRGNPVRNGWRNADGTYGIVDERGEVVKRRGKKQLFRGKSAADNMCRELNEDPFEEYTVVKLK